MTINPRRAYAAELVGSMLLLATVVGSGIMADRLSGGNVAIALLANTIATGAGLVALILTFGPISGAHFNPAVLALWGRYAACCDYVPLGDLKEAGSMFHGLALVDMVET